MVQTLPAPHAMAWVQGGYRVVLDVLPTLQDVGTFGPWGLLRCDMLRPGLLPFVVVVGSWPQGVGVKPPPSPLKIKRRETKNDMALRPREVWFLFSRTNRNGCTRTR